jgi:hypothetical protein
MFFLVEVVFLDVLQRGQESIQLRLGVVKVCLSLDPIRKDGSLIVDPGSQPLRLDLPLVLLPLIQLHLHLPLLAIFGNPSIL